MTQESRQAAALEYVLARSRGAGATAADVMVVETHRQSVRVRLGAVERVERAGVGRIGVRVFVGARSAISSTNDLSTDSLARLVDDALACARLTAEDPFAGLPDAAAHAGVLPPGPEFDERARDLSLDEAVALARRSEEAARAVDERIRNSEGAAFASATSRVWLANTSGFSGSYEKSRFDLHVQPVAQAGGAREVDTWGSTRTHLADLESPESVGRRAAQRALRRLGARKIGTTVLPVVFEPPVAGRLLGHLAEAVSGDRIYQGASYLAGCLGERVASPGVTVVDDPLLARGVASAPFDGEGVPGRRTVLVEQGVLRSYLLDSYAARKLGMASTGAASRSAAVGPSPGASNLRIEAGPHPADDIVREMKRGLVVTSLLGFGVNVVSGEFSQGVTGVLIEDGEPVHAVSEVTVAGTLQGMLQGIERVGDDLDIHRLPSAPTLRIGAMTVAGS